MRQLLQAYCAAYKRIILQAEHGGGYSGSRILEVRPIRADGLAELPAILKIGPINVIEREWQAYKSQVQFRLPNAVPVAEAPRFFPELKWGVLRYQLAGYGTYTLIGLSDYWRRPEVTVAQAVAVLEKLLAGLHPYWQAHRPVSQFTYQASYDHLLPVNLQLEATPAAPTPSLPLLTPGVPLATFGIGDWVQLSDFVVQKSNPATQTVTLCEPASDFQASKRFLRLRIADEAEHDWQYNGTIGPLPGQIRATRESFWQAKLTGLIDQPLDVARITLELASGDLLLRNPLLVAEEWLQHRQTVFVGPIHGDLNLENILVEPNTGNFNLIDYADARRDHTLHDLLRLETEIITKLLPHEIRQQALMPAETLAGIYGGLARLAPVANGVTHTDWGCPKSWHLLVLIRRQASVYLAEPEQMTEYYNGLCLYLLGATKFKNLRQAPSAPLPEWLAFWGAALTDHLLQGCTLPSIPWRQAPEAVACEPPIATEAEIFLPHHYVAAWAPPPAGSHIRFGRNLDFAGRNRELRQLARLLQAPGSVVVVQGMGGVGKSQLASEFAHRYGHFFPGGVFWLSFADPAGVANEVAACGPSSLLPQHPGFAELPLPEQAAWVRQGWDRPVPRLLVFDSCEDVVLFERWQPLHPACRIIVTCRPGEWPGLPGVTLLPLAELPRADSITMLRCQHPDASDEVLNHIAEEVGDLPLALNLAGHFLKRHQNWISPEEYLRRLRDPARKQDMLLGGRGHSPTNHDQNIARIMALSLERLHLNIPNDYLARELLQMLAFLAPGELVPQPLVGHLWNALPAERQSTTLQRVLGRLLATGLLQPDEEDALRLHRLIYDQLRLATSWLDLARQRVMSVLEKAISEALALQRVRTMRHWHPHFRAVADEGLRERSPLALRLVKQICLYYRETGDYHNEQTLLVKLLAAHKGLSAGMNAEKAQLTARLGLAYQRLGDLAQARHHFRVALAYQQAHLGKYHIDTAETYNYVGFMLQSLPRLDVAKARLFHEWALQGRRRALGPDHPEVANSYCNLAFLAYSEANWSQTLALLEKARAIMLARYGPWHRETLKVQQYIAETRHKLGDLAGAENLLLTILPWRRQLTHNQHPEVAETLHELGAVMMAKGCLAEAQGYLEQALAIRQRLSPTHHLTRETEALLARVCSQISV
ncbi:MAG: tetratricopeptide repeat protein [Anaerolineales bacterium]|nr:tetratricopeptide repeat protein [Anaerolineales bacterium]